MTVCRIPVTPNIITAVACSRLFSMAVAVGDVGTYAHIDDIPRGPLQR